MNKMIESQSLRESGLFEFPLGQQMQDIVAVSQSLRESGLFELIIIAFVITQKL